MICHKKNNHSGYGPVKYLICTIIVSFSLLSSYAQNRGFSKEPTVFIEELGTYIKDANSPQTNRTYVTFKEAWNVSLFDEDHQSVIIRMNEYMVLNKFKVDPEFNLLMSTLLAGRDSMIKYEKFDAWLLSMYKLIKADRTMFLEVLKTSNMVFSANTIQHSSSHSWKFSETDYQFKFTPTAVSIELKNIDLTCNGPDDKIMIRETYGVFDVMSKAWKGKGGMLSWERVGISETEAFAKLPEYQIDMNRGELEIEHIKFQYKGVLNEEIDGKLTDKISSRTLNSDNDNFEKASYPRFVSYRKDLTINGFIHGDIKFIGGFSIEGNNIQGIGDKDNKATFEFYYEGKKIFSTSSSNFSFQEGKIGSLETELTIYTDSGQIYHPNVIMSFNRSSKELLITRGNKGLQQAPFYNTDHNIEMWIDRIKWTLESAKVEFDMIQEDDNARFESKNFYKDFNFEKITKGLMRYHPIVELYKLQVSLRSRKFKLESYARFLGSKKENLLPQILALADEGFIYYNIEAEEITVKDKLINYYLYHFKLADYDVIRFSSVIGKNPNAILNLVNYDLEIEGVRVFRFSDSQNVTAIPANQYLVLKNNRRLIFDGRVTAGRFDFYGEGFDFNYDKFTITSEKIDSMRIFFPDTINGNFLIPIKSVLRDIHGTIYIDKANNKSGLVNHPQYPRFVSQASSVIAYDKKSIYGGAYKKDSFRFEVDPFSIDSMDNFTIKGLRFPGTFVSGGILPEFKYEASIMKDYSLGFVRANPPGGYPMYDGKGHADIDVSMSEEGFKAKGTIEYEGAKLSSSNIIMMPDSTNAEVDEYSIKRNERYPRVVAQNVRTHWLPKENKMYVNTKGHEVDIFESGQIFTGVLMQTPLQLSGKGDLAWDDANLYSKNMRFSPDKTDADTSNIRIGDVDAGKISFVSTNVRSHIDFTERTGTFRSNVVGQLTDLPYNQFATTLDEFKWDMDKKTIELTPTGRSKPEFYTFLSKNPDQKGLKFQSTKALFDMNDGIIYAEEVPYIDVADSRIFPFNGKVVIEKDAYIRPLEQSKLLASRANKYHELYDCKLNVLGRYALTGSGYLEYKDKHKTGQIIFFDKMRVMLDTTVQALSLVKDSVDFTVSPKIGFKGGVELNSSHLFLNFNGYVIPKHTFADYPSVWFRYQSRQDPNNVIINTVDPKNEDRKGIDVTMSLSANDSINIYPAFFNFKGVYADMDVTSNQGIMFYDEIENAFVTGDSNKLLNGAPKGNILTFNEASREISSEGLLNFDLDLNPNFNVKTAGRVSKHEDDTTFTIDCLFALKVALPDECYNRMIAVIEKNGADAPTTKPTGEGTIRALSELMDAKKYDKVLKELNETGELKLIDEINKDILINHMEFFYSRPLRAFVSVEPIELAAVHGTQVNKAFKSRMLIENKRSGTRFVFYVEISKYDYFYFEYQRGNLYVYSTDKEFNEALRAKSRKINQKGYNIRPASPVKVSRELEKIDNFAK
ncbi:MAG: hypothetical protein ACI83I_001508 [Bacteroidia bacterium]|jgi:hypothetical protein